MPNVTLANKQVKYCGRYGILFVSIAGMQKEQ